MDPSPTQRSVEPLTKAHARVVAERGRGRGIGRALVSAMANECRRRGIARARVAVGTGNEPACRFYERCGFVLAQTSEHHGRPTNIYVIDL